MSHISLFESVESLDGFLGDPKISQNLLSFQKNIRLDEDEEYPQESCQHLNCWGLNQYYVPVAYGGKLASFYELLALTQTVARRDITTAIAHASTFLAANTIWESGDEEQKRTFARSILAGKVFSLGLTETAHGSDLSATDTVLEACDGGYRLSGSKWLINNASKGNGIIVLCKSSDSTNYRNLSLVLVEKECLEQTEFSLDPHVKTHGVRGADISGIHFRLAKLPQSALVGEAGSGLETTMKALQISRTMCAGLSLGAAQTTMDVTLDFAFSRVLYKDTIFKIPYVRRSLINAFVDMLACDAVAISACRALHVVPKQFSVWSAVVKCFVPTTIEQVIRQFSTVLGARHYLREHCSYGIFQKMMRDNALISLFDGNTAVNLQSISLQLQFLFAHFQEQITAPEQLPTDRIASIFSLDQCVQPYQWGHLELFNHGKDDCLSGLIHAQVLLQDKFCSVGTDMISEAILEAINVAHSVIDDQVHLLANLRDEYGRGANKSYEIFQMASAYCKLHAFAACVNLWAYNRHSLEGAFVGDSWMVVAAFRILKDLGYEKKLPRLLSLLPAQIDKLARILEQAYIENRMFSLFPNQLCVADGQKLSVMSEN